MPSYNVALVDKISLVLYGSAIPSNSTVDSVLHRLFIVDFTFVIVILELCQCVVTLRIWHLFLRSRFIRWLAVTVFTVSAAGTAMAAAIKFTDVRNAMFWIYDPSTSSPNTSFLSVIYLPALLVHTTMLSLTIHRFCISSAALQTHGIIHRFLKEGVFVYAFAAGALLYEIIGLSLTGPRDISVFYSALGGEIAVATTAVSVCRAMISIRSLAATYHVDSTWLLNHAELSRVQWRRGTTEGEIFVEVNEMDVVLPSGPPELPALKTEYLGKI
ncbi:uncharacterized protein EDB91DRAFT_1175361 [Suillus paluster]|uniref:uncharacterized protein n=1 Tax=Suillus paluster TaxID=48578 RepID=UPI001B860706|nr:uncharacterized protein EDB91DRAFT_1175361 [Suillus paluster]KAG1722031.1 hypothetical protein EDB91DRAFT_1175361 [Suillus paluster]